MQAIDTNTLYLGVAFLIAIVIGIGLLKSDRLKATLKKWKLYIDAGKNPEKHQHSMEQVVDSELDLTQKDGHEVEIKKIKNSTITVRK